MLPPPEEEEEEGPEHEPHAQNLVPREREAPEVDRRNPLVVADPVRKKRRSREPMNTRKRRPSSEPVENEAVKRRPAMES
jgi:hypothetical protein